MRSRFPPAVDAIRLTLCGVVVILTLLGVGCSGDAQSADTSLPHTFGAEDAADPSAAADLVRAEPVPVAEAPSWLIERAGDATTTFEVSERSYNLSARNVGLTARIRFAGGDEIFEAVFTSCFLGSELVSSAAASLAPDTAALLASATAAALGTGVTVLGVDALSCATFACPAFALRPRPRERGFVALPPVLPSWVGLAFGWW
mgnify:CR=1 FL=1